MFLILIYFLVSLSRAEVAEASVCLNEQRTEALMAKYQFRTGPVLPGIPPSPLVWDRCQSDSLTYKVMESLLFLQDMPWSSPLKDDFDQNILGQNLYDFFAQRVQQIVIEPETNKSCAAATIAFARDNTGTNVMHVCPAANKFSLLVRVGVLIHEARHFDGEFGHTLCERGDLIGDFACDPRYETQGAYAAETEFYVRATRTQELPEEIRREARAMVIDRMVNRFNQWSLNIKESALLIDDQGRGYLYDGHQIELFLESLAPSSIVSLRGNLPLIFDPEVGEVTTLLTSHEGFRTDGAFAQLLRDMPRDERLQALDVYYGKYACVLFAREILCKQNEIIVRFPLPEDLVASHFVIMGKVIGNDDIVLILAQDGRMYTMPYSEKLSDWSTNKIERLENLNDYHGLGVLPGFRRIALLSDGRLARLPEGEKIYQVIVEHSALRFTKLRAPFYWSKRFDEL